MMGGHRLRLRPTRDACGKRRYYELAAAEVARRHVEAKSRARGGTSAGLEVKVYYCSRCRALHVGRGS